jgi:hypothetical protein
MTSKRDGSGQGVIISDKTSPSHFVHSRSALGDRRLEECVPDINSLPSTTYFPDDTDDAAIMTAGSDDHQDAIHHKKPMSSDQTHSAALKSETNNNELRDCTSVTDQRCDAVLMASHSGNVANSGDVFVDIRPSSPLDDVSSNASVVDSRRTRDADLLTSGSTENYQDSVVIPSDSVQHSPMMTSCAQLGTSSDNQPDTSCSDNDVVNVGAVADNDSVNSCSSTAQGGVPNCDIVSTSSEHFATAVTALTQMDHSDVVLTQLPRDAVVPRSENKTDMSMNGPGLDGALVSDITTVMTTLDADNPIMTRLDNDDSVMTKLDHNSVMTGLDNDTTVMTRTEESGVATSQSNCDGAMLLDLSERDGAECTGSDNEGSLLLTLSEHDCDLLMIPSCDGNVLLDDDGTDLISLSEDGGLVLTASGDADLVLSQSVHDGGEFLTRSYKDSERDAPVTACLSEDNGEAASVMRTGQSGDTSLDRGVAVWTPLDNNGEKELTSAAERVGTMVVDEECGAAYMDDDGATVMTWSACDGDSVSASGPGAGENELVESINELVEDYTELIDSDNVASADLENGVTSAMTLRRASLYRSTSALYWSSSSNSCTCTPVSSGPLTSEDEDGEELTIDNVFEVCHSNYTLVTPHHTLSFVTKWGMCMQLLLY